MTCPVCAARPVTDAGMCHPCYVEVHRYRQLSRVTIGVRIMASIIRLRRLWIALHGVEHVHRLGDLRAAVDPDRTAPELYRKS